MNRKIRTAFSIWLIASFAFCRYCLGTETLPAAADSPALVQIQSVEAAVALIENRYRDAMALTAKVMQKNFLKSVNKTQTFEGTLFIKKPGKLRLEYANGQMIIIENTEAWFYSKKSEQAIRRTFKDFEQSNIPVAFLLGAAEIKQEFEATAAETNEPGALDLVPKKKNAAMKKLRLVYDSSGLITEMTIFDKSGNTSQVSFSEIREGVELADTLFRFKAPKGTEIIEQ